MTTLNDKITNTDLDQILTGHADWRPAVDALVAYWTEQGLCFSSGEVASALREHRSDLMFQVTSVGSYLRDLLYAQTMPGYDDGMGGSEQPVQVLRPCEGLYPDRTPAGTEVYVYGPDFDACEGHEFEVYIPCPWNGESVATAPAPAMGQTAKAKADPSGKTPTAVAILGAKIAVEAGKIRCGVQPDKRLTVPRNAFEYAVSLGGHPLRGGDSVWAVQDDDTVTVYTTDPGDPSQREYKLTTDRGRVLIPSDGTPFTPGETYKVEVAAGKLVINTAAPVNG